MEIDTSWHDWKKTLGKAVGAAEFVGMSDEMINKIAYHLGNFFASKIDPANREQRLLKELWEVGTVEEKRVLARIISKLVNQKPLH
ncbi:MAG: DUF3243 domain-containing protein [Desulfotomaculaceae bacterium]|nr:DUF3243 domain-containing protein [Desulfotomaculaceae bacterium]